MFGGCACAHLRDPGGDVVVDALAPPLELHQPVDRGKLAPQQLLPLDRRCSVTSQVIHRSQVSCGSAPSSWVCCPSLELLYFV